MMNILTKASVSVAAILIGVAALVFALEHAERMRLRREYFKVSRLVHNVTLEGGGVVNSKSSRIRATGLVPGAYLDISCGDRVELSYLNETGDESRVFEVTFDQGDGEYRYRARQRLMFEELQTISDFTPWVVFQLDTTPPSGTAQVSDIPATGNWPELPIWLKVDSPDATDVEIRSQSGEEYRYPMEPEMMVKLPISEGKLTLEFFLVDAAGNLLGPLESRTTEVDRTAPVISRFPLLSTWSAVQEGHPSAASMYQENVSVYFDQFYGPLYGYASAPLAGRVTGKLKSLEVHGKRVAVGQDGVINARIRLYVRRGTNTYKVRAVDLAGNVGTGTVTLDWDIEEASQQSDLESRLDDIEGRLEEIQELVED